MKKPWKLALVVAGVAVVAKLVISKKAAWQGLTEAELREKLDSRLPSQMPDDKRAAVADKVVAKMHERGAIREDETTSAAPPADSAEAADPAADDEEVADDSEAS